MKIRTKRDCAKAAKLIGAEDITALTVAEACGLSESEESSKRRHLKLKLGVATTRAELWGVLNEAPKGSEIERTALKKLLEISRTQEERWVLLPEAPKGSEIWFEIVRKLIAHATKKDELLKIHRDNSMDELGEEALRKLCEIL